MSTDNGASLLSIPVTLSVLKEDSKHISQLLSFKVFSNH